MDIAGYHRIAVTCHLTDVPSLLNSLCELRDWLDESEAAETEGVIRL